MSSTYHHVVYYKNQKWYFLMPKHTIFRENNAVIKKKSVKMMLLEKKIRFHGKKLVKIKILQMNLQFDDFFRENDEFYFYCCCGLASHILGKNFVKATFY